MEGILLVFREVVSRQVNRAREEQIGDKARSTSDRKKAFLPCCPRSESEHDAYLLPETEKVIDSPSVKTRSKDCCSIFPGVKEQRTKVFSSTVTRTDERPSLTSSSNAAYEGKMEKAKVRSEVAEKRSIDQAAKR
jgi:hypothetical protein